MRWFRRRRFDAKDEHIVSVALVTPPVSVGVTAIPTSSTVVDFQVEIAEILEFEIDPPVEVDRAWMASDPVFDVIAKHLGGSKCNP